MRHYINILLLISLAGLPVSLMAKEKARHTIVSGYELVMNANQTNGFTVYKVDSSDFGKISVYVKNSDVAYFLKQMEELKKKRFPSIKVKIWNNKYEYMRRKD